MDVTLQERDPADLIHRARTGDPRATDELMPLIYDQLRRLAARYMGAEAPGHTLQATALVNEAYVRLARGEADDWKDRAYFFGAAATAVRRILVEHARSRGNRRWHERPRATETVDVEQLAGELDDGGLLAIDEALERLAAVNAQHARVVELRFFGGLTVDEIASAVGVSPRTVAREWALAKAWLGRELRAQGFGD